MQTNLVSYTFRRHSEAPFGHDKTNFNGITLGHVAVHNSSNANAGDTLLPWAIRAAFDQSHGAFGWQLHHLWDRFSSRTVTRLNEETDGLIVGGGGFLMKDQRGSDIRRSGWAWNISMEGLAKLTKPYCLFAVGYNRFRNQEDFDQNFHDHINLTVEKAAFVGLRNSGSIRQVGAYLNSQSLRDKLTLQFCPTTCAYQFWPDYAAIADGFEAEFDNRPRPVLAFNFAGDRLDMRFGDSKDSQMSKCARVMREAQGAGWQIVLVTHKEIDRQIEPFLDEAGVEYVTHDLTYATYLEILAFYARIDLAVGMRGHSQLIPLGLRKPILSIISHNKMGYLLEDIGQPDWGVDVEDQDWSERLLALIDEVGLSQRVQTLEAVKTAQKQCWSSTEVNVAQIIELFKR